MPSSILPLAKKSTRNPPCKALFKIQESAFFIISYLPVTKKKKEFYRGAQSFLWFGCDGWSKMQGYEKRIICGIFLAVTCPLTFLLVSTSMEFLWILLSYIFGLLKCLLEYLEGNWCHLTFLSWLFVCHKLNFDGSALRFPKSSALGAS